jgi:hypothetical protein
VYCLKIPKALSNKFRDGDTQRVLVDIRNITSVNPSALTTVQTAISRIEAQWRKKRRRHNEYTRNQLHSTVSISIYSSKNGSKDADTINIYRKLFAVDFRDGDTILLETKILMGRRKRQEIYNIMFESLKVWHEGFVGFKAWNCWTKRGETEYAYLQVCSLSRKTGWKAHRERQWTLWLNGHG